MNKIILLIVAMLFVCAPNVFADKPGKNKPTATEKVGNEVADSIADALTNDSSKPNKGSMPPGLAKKDKVPPGWSKGEKTGWTKDGKSDSPIRSFFKNLFGNKD